MKGFLEKFLKKKVLGLYLSDDSIQALQLEGNLRNPKVKSMAYQVLPAEIIRNGEILQKDYVIQEMGKMIAQAKPEVFKAKKCVVPIPESQVFEHIFYFPKKMRRKDFQNSLQKKVNEIFPIPVEEINYDYDLSFHGNIMVVFVAAVRKKIVQDYDDVAKSLNRIKKVVLEPEYLSLLRNLPFNLDKDEGTILIDINGNKISYFTLWNQNIFDSNLMFSNNVGSNYEYLINDLAQSMNLFNNITKRAVKRFLISALEDEAAVLKPIIENSLKIPVELIENYRFCPALNQDDQCDPIHFKVVTGSALRSLGDPLKTNICFSG